MNSSALFLLHLTAVVEIFMFGSRPTAQTKMMGGSLGVAVWRERRGHTTPSLANGSALEWERATNAIS